MCKNNDIFAVVEENGEHRTTLELSGKNIIISEWEGSIEIDGIVVSIDKVRNLAYCLTVLANSLDGGRYDADDCKRCITGRYTVKE